MRSLKLIHIKFLKTLFVVFLLLGLFLGAFPSWAQSKTVRANLHNDDALTIVNKDWDFSLGDWNATHGWTCDAYAMEGDIEANDKAEYIVTASYSYANLITEDDVGPEPYYDREEYVLIEQTMNSYDLGGETLLTVEIKWQLTATSYWNMSEDPFDWDTAKLDYSLYVQVGTDKYPVATWYCRWGEDGGSCFCPSDDDCWQHGPNPTRAFKPGLTRFTVTANQATSDLPLKIVLHAKYGDFGTMMEASIYWVNVTIGDNTGTGTPTSSSPTQSSTPGFVVIGTILSLGLVTIVLRRYFKRKS
ncbi:MAG: hypothetical protein ACFFC7_13930 [Candidatus Hermodarchaeota archaeon]